MSKKFRHFIYASKSGLTLVELLMLILILSVVASVTLPLGKIQYVRAREEELRLYLADFRRGISMYNAANFPNYPKSLQEMVDNHFLRRIPREPLGNRWQYSTSAAPGTWKDFTFYGTSYEVSAGPDDIGDIRSDGSRCPTGINGTSYTTW